MWAITNINADAETDIIVLIQLKCADIQIEQIWLKPVYLTFRSKFSGSGTTGKINYSTVAKQSHIWLQNRK